MARTQQSRSDSRKRIRKAEYALRQEIRQLDDASALRMSVLRERAKRVLLERLRSLKEERFHGVPRGRGRSLYRRHPLDDASGGSHFTHLGKHRKKLIKGGEDAILVEYGVEVHVAIGGVNGAQPSNANTALLTSQSCDGCGALLVFLGADEHGIERGQLACLSCGGMFELDQ